MPRRSANSLTTIFGFFSFVNDASICAFGATGSAARPPRAPEGDGPGRGSKRCSSARLQASGYRFIYPGYREGYAAVLDTGS